jgi:hypothetical protein
MKKKECLTVSLVFVILSTAVLFLTVPMPVNAAEKCNIITIYDRGNMSTQHLRINKGDCVIWINWKKKENVFLSFETGEKCISAVERQVDFKLDVQSSCFVAQGLSYGQTVSLVFKETGSYKYDIVFEGDGKTSATIEVVD